jgi:transcription termination factor Rho
MELDLLKGKKVAELREIAEALGVKGTAKLKKKEILDLLIKMHEEAVSKTGEEKAAIEEPKENAKKPAEDGKRVYEWRPEQPKQEAPKAAEEETAEEGTSTEGNSETEEPLKDGRIEKTGILDLADGGFGFLRFNNFLTSDEDIYVSPAQIRRFNLRTGDKIRGIARKPNDGERFGALLYVKSVNDEDPGTAKQRKNFSDLTPIYPTQRITLEKGSRELSMRLIDLVAPIGKGQRGMIVAPPKAGKTTLLKQIAKSIERQKVDAELIVLLIDERPEEVTDMKRSIKGCGGIGKRMTL